MSILDCVVGCSVIGFYVPSMLCYGLIRVLCSIPLLHCVVGWSVFVFYVPSKL